MNGGRSRIYPTSARGEESRTPGHAVSIRVLVGAQDIGPFVDLELEILCEEVRPGGARRDDADLIEALAQRRVGERGIERSGELVGDLAGRALGQVHADPGGRLIALEAELVEGRRVRELL